MISLKIFLNRKWEKEIQRLIQTWNSEALKWMRIISHSGLKSLYNINCWFTGLGQCRRLESFKMETFPTPCSLNLIQPNLLCLSLLSAQSQLTAVSHTPSSWLLVSHLGCSHSFFVTVHSFLFYTLVSHEQPDDPPRRLCGRQGALQCARLYYQWNLLNPAGRNHSKRLSPGRSSLAHEFILLCLQCSQLPQRSQRVRYFMNQ